MRPSERLIASHFTLSLGVELMWDSRRFERGFRPRNPSWGRPRRGPRRPPPNCLAGATRDDVVDELERGVQLARVGTAALGEVGPAATPEIGRASCRERVCYVV